MQIVIELADLVYEQIKTHGNISEFHELINSGTPLPKGHGRLIDVDKIISEATERMKYPANHEYMECVIAHMKLASTIIEADKENEAEVIIRGKCMMCGKELTEGLFFCKECGDKANSGK